MLKEERKKGRKDGLKIVLTCTGPAEHHHPGVAQRPARGDVPRAELSAAGGQRLRHRRVPHLYLGWSRPLVKLTNELMIENDTF